MTHLKAIPNTELSEYALRLLHRHQIFTVQEFMKESDEKLAFYLNVNARQVNTIRKRLCALYGPIRRTLYDVIKQRDYWRSISPYGTGIQSLDNVLQEERLQSGSVWEICGRAGVGKTQLCFTIIINYLLKQKSQTTIQSVDIDVFKSEVLYIDTKLDFNARRITAIIQARSPEMPQQLCAQLLQSIKVERCFTLANLRTILERLLNSLTTNNEASNNTKNIGLIIIDSLSALWFQYNLDDSEQNVTTNWLLLKINQLAHQLANKHGLAVIFVNLALPINTRSRGKHFEEMKSSKTTKCIDAEESIGLNDPFSQYLINSSCFNNTSQSDSRALRPCTGRNWQLAPNLRLSLNHLQLEYPSRDSQKSLNSSLREIRVMKCFFLPIGLHCQVELTAKGFI